MSEHLGELAAALVDGELDHDQRDRALAHITYCDECRAEVDAQRRLKALLANQSDPEASPALAARLLAVPRDAAGSTKRDVVRPSARRRRRAPRAAAYSALGVALLAGVVAAGGGAQGRKVRPPVSSFVDEHAATTGRLGNLNDPAGNVVLTLFGR
jgi:anti-sigma factor RsiW